MNSLNWLLMGIFIGLAGVIITLLAIMDKIGEIVNKETESYTTLQDECIDVSEEMSLYKYMKGLG